MTRIKHNSLDLDTALRTLDAADFNVDPASLRARADLERILATNPHVCPEVPSQDRAGRAATHPWSLRRVAVVGGALAVVTTGVLALPALTGGDQAFASWASVPDEMTLNQRTDAADNCRQAEMEGAGADYTRELRTAELAIAERRGVWNTVVLVGPDGFAALCITDGSTGLFTHDMIGSIGTPTNYAAPRPRELTATDLGSATLSAGDLSLAAGTVGTAIVGISYTSRSHGQVTATVSNGRFALWFPGDELKDANSTGGVEVEVTYRDGTTGTGLLQL